MKSIKNYVKLLAVFFLLLPFSCRKSEQRVNEQSSLVIETKEEKETVEQFLTKLKKEVNDFETEALKRDIQFPLVLKTSVSNYEFTFEEFTDSKQGLFISKYLDKIKFVKNTSKFKDVDGIVFYEKIIHENNHKYVEDDYRIEFYIKEFKGSFKLTKIVVIFF